MSLSIAEGRVARFYNERGTAWQLFNVRTPRGGLSGRGFLVSGVRGSPLAGHDFDADHIRLLSLVPGLERRGLCSSACSSAKHSSLVIDDTLGKFVQIGTQAVRHVSYLTFQLAKVAVPRRLLKQVVTRIEELRIVSDLAPS